jgi:cell shape-determining protein MreC
MELKVREEKEEEERRSLFLEYLEAYIELRKLELIVPEREKDEKEKKPSVLGPYENSIIINIGKQYGVQEGNIFYVYRYSYLLGKICVNKVYDKFSLGSITDDSKYQFDSGDEVTKERKNDERIINNDIEIQFKIQRRDTESPTDGKTHPWSEEDKPK